MNSLPCVIALLPDEELTEKTLIASANLHILDVLVTLEMGKYFPHLSLYMCQLRIKDMPKIEETLRSVARAQPVLSLNASKYSVSEGYAAGYVDPEYQVTEELRKLQRTVVEGINPLRDGMMAKDLLKPQDADGLMLENLQKYGFAPIGKLFRPHITLTRLKDSNADVLSLLPDVGTFNGTFDRLGIFEMGDNGTCITQLSEFQLVG
jgi:hypothetical protein